MCCLEAEIKWYIDTHMLHVNFVSWHVEINKSHVNMIMLHIDIIHLA